MYTIEFWIYFEYTRTAPIRTDSFLNRPLPVMAEESLDNEAIQARIELSLSLAQDLVSSWVKPYETTSKSKNFEEELKDYLRRPPRFDEWS